jgi:hypothetical protein
VFGSLLHKANGAIKMIIIDIVHRNQDVSVETDPDKIFKYNIFVDGRKTQSQLEATAVIRWLGNRMHGDK